jgi:hypothetical protein
MTDSFDDIPEIFKEYVSSFLTKEEKITILLKHSTVLSINRENNDVVDVLREAKVMPFTTCYGTKYVFWSRPYVFNSGEIDWERMEKEGLYYKKYGDFFKESLFTI